MQWLGIDIDVEELIFGDGLRRGDLTAGDAAAALMWSTSLWFVSPLQLLLLFLGKIETERPSDWLMNVRSTYRCCACLYC